MAQRHSVDDYLETIWFLAFPIGEYRPATTGSPALASRVAEMLGVSRASAGEMLKRMEKDGLVQRGEHKEAILTKTGRVLHPAIFLIAGPNDDAVVTSHQTAPAPSGARPAAT